MEDTTMIELWRSYDKKLEATLSLNREMTADITKIKVRSFLSSMKPVKLFTILAGMLWVGFGAVILVNIGMFAFDKVSPFFFFSAAIQVLLTAIALFIYIYQLVLIYQVDIAEPILKTQERLARLRSSTLWVTRMLFLQLPVWTTFFWTENLLVNSPVPVLIVLGIVTLSFVYIAAWLFCNIRYENRNKKWFRIIFSGKEWDPVIRSMELLNQVEEYRDEK